MRVLVTGADGFVAGHLVEALRAGGHEVVGSVLTGPAPDGLVVHPLDITDAAAVDSVFRVVQPTHVVHLAAVSGVSQSLAHPERTQRVNVGGTENVLRSAAALTPLPRVLIIGSGEEYGRNDGRPLPELPLSELRPLSPYAESKVAVERLIEATPAYRRVNVRTRSFPHIGPGQKLGFFTADMASQLVRIQRGAQEPVLRVGNLDAVRDFSDVRDTVRAYVLLLERGTVGEVYNVCSGRGIAMRDLLDAIIHLAGITVRVERDPARMRPSDVPVLVGDNAKLKKVTGWAPRIPLEQSLRDILAWWRRQS